MRSRFGAGLEGRMTNQDNMWGGRNSDIRDSSAEDFLLCQHRIAISISNLPAKAASFPLTSRVGSRLAASTTEHLCKQTG